MWVLTVKFDVFVCESVHVVLILMLTTTSVSAIHWQDPILGIASADKGGGGVSDVLGAVRDLCLKTF